MSKKYTLYDMENGDNSIIGEYESADIAMTAAWDEFNAGNEDVFLVNPNGGTYTPAKKPNENPFQNLVYRRAGELDSRHMTIAQGREKVWELFNDGIKTAYLLNENGNTYTPANKPDSENPMHTPEIKPNGIVIALDAGHGMKTSGKRTPAFPKAYPNIKKGEVIRENEANRAVASRATQGLVRCGFTVVHTADMTGKTDVSLSDRQRACRNADAKLMISFHFNAGGGEGVSIYHHNKYTSSAAKRFAEIHIKKLAAVKGQRIRGVKTKAFAVCNESQTKCPSVLIEHAFMDDPRWIEPPWMRENKYLDAAADALVRSVCELFNVPYIAA